MITQTISMSSKADLVQAYETLREAVVCSGASAATPVGGQRLLSEGLLSRGRHYRPCGAQIPVLNPGRHGAPQEFHTPSEHPRAAVVSIMATMALHTIDSPEAIS